MENCDNDLKQQNEEPKRKRIESSITVAFGTKEIGSVG